MKRSHGVLALAWMLSACATPKTFIEPRVSILGINSSGGATRTQDGREEQLTDLVGARAALEGQLLKQGVVIQGDMDASRVSGPPAEGEPLLKNVMLVTKYGRPTSPKTVRYGVTVSIRHNIGLLTAFSLGLLPYTIDITARVTDIQTREIRASVSTRAVGSIFNSRGVYKGMRKLGDGIVIELRRLQYGSDGQVGGNIEGVSL